MHSQFEEFESGSEKLTEKGENGRNSYDAEDDAGEKLIGHHSSSQESTKYCGNVYVTTSREKKSRTTLIC